MDNVARESLDKSQQHGTDVGTMLRKTREAYGKSLPDVERVLRIRECQLAAIEAGDISKLPGRVYAIGFVRTYAEYLGLDGGESVRLFKAQYMDAQPRETLEFAIPASDTKIPSVWLAVFLVVVLTAGSVYWMQTQQSDRSIVDDIPPLESNVEAQAPETEEATVEAVEQVYGPSPQPIEAVAAPVDGGAAVIAPAPALVADVPVAEQNGLILKLIENSWVEIKDAQGKIIVSTVLKTGDQYFVPDNPGLTMSLGNAGGIEIVMNGRIMKPLGKTGDIRRDIPLDTDYLKTLEFKEVTPAAGVVQEEKAQDEEVETAPEPEDR